MKTRFKGPESRREPRVGGYGFAWFKKHLGTRKSSLSLLPLFVNIIAEKEKLSFWRGERVSFLI